MAEDHVVEGSNPSGPIFNYKGECCCRKVSVEDVVIDLFIQNSQLLVEEAKAGDVLTYKMARTYGKGLTHIM